MDGAVLVRGSQSAAPRPIVEAGSQHPAGRVPLESRVTQDVIDGKLMTAVSPPPERHQGATDCRTPGGKR